MKRYSQDSKTAFKKFKLVPADEYEKPAQLKIRDVEKFLRNYNPTLSGMVNSYSGMHTAVNGKTLGRTAKDRLSLLNSNRARLLHLQKGAFQIGNVASQQQQQLEEPKNGILTAEKVADVDELPWMDAEELDTKFKMESADSKPILEKTPTSAAVPSWSKDKLTLIKDLVGNAIKPNRLGELMINNKTVRNASYDKVMQSLFVDGNVEVPGLSEAVKELKRIGVPVEMLESQRARNLFVVVNPKQKGSGQFRGKMKKPAGKQLKILRLY